MSYNDNNTQSTQSNRRLEEFPELLPEHLQEWLDSGVDERIVRANVRSATGEQLFSHLYPNLDHTARRNDGRLRDNWSRRLDALAATSGWIVGSIDPTNWVEWMPEFFRYKIVSGQIIDHQKKKPQKYRSPAGVKSRLVLLDVDDANWERQAERYGCPIEESDRDKGYWYWVFKNNVAITLCEGEKKAGSLLTQGRAAIALPGIYSGFRKNEDGTRSLIPDLAVFDTKHRSVTICFDFESDSKKAYRVEQAAISTAYCFKNAGVRIAYLPGPEKGIDDFIVAGGDVNAIYRDAKPLNAIKAEQAWKLSFKPDLELNQRYLGEPAIPQSGLVCIKSPKGTGKTTALKPVVYKATGAGRKTLLLTHRIVLGQAICDAVGLPYISEIRDSEQGRVAGFGLCIDSCHPQGQGQINPDDWAGAIVIIDEVEQVIWHLLNSTTCMKTRVLILKTLKALISHVLSTGGLVIAQDADLSNYAVEFLQGCAGFPIQPWVCVNNWKPEQGQNIEIFVPQEKKPDIAAALLSQAAKEVNQGGKIFICCDAQKAGSTYGTKNIESYLESECPGANFIRIDSETVADPNHPAYNCAGKINEIVGDYDGVITSPTIATGVSIDVRGHFTGVYGFFHGSISENEVRQSLARVREPVPRYIWVRDKAVARIGNGADNYKQLIDSKQKDIKLNCRLLKEADFDIDKAADPIALRTWAKMAARDNISRWDLRMAVQRGLQAEGHIISIVKSSDDNTASEMKQIKEAAWDEEDEAVVAAVDISDEEFEKLQEKRSRTETERLTERKYNLKKSYAVEVVPGLHKLDQQRWRPQILLHYYLSHDPKFLELRDRKHLAGHIERGEGEVCAQDIRLLTLQVEMYRKLGIFDFAMGAKSLTKTSPELKDWLKKRILPYRKDIKDILGITISPKMAEDDPIRALQNLLAKTGYQLKGKQKRNEDGEQERVYQDLEPKSKLEREGDLKYLRGEIFTAWQKRDQEALDWKPVEQPVDQPVEAAETVSPVTNLSHQTLIKENNLDVTSVRESAVTPETPQQTNRGAGRVLDTDQPEDARFKQGAVVRWAGKVGKFVVNWCGRIGTAAIRDLATGKAFNAEIDELSLDGGAMA